MYQPLLSGPVLLPGALRLPSRLVGGFRQRYPDADQRARAVAWEPNGGSPVVTMAFKTQLGVSVNDMI